MSDMENARARKEAVETSSRATSSANRQRLWAGMNRYLAVETEHARRTAVKEQQDEGPKPAAGPDRS